MRGIKGLVTETSLLDPEEVKNPATRAPFLFSFMKEIPLRARFRALREG
jgi:hypothetical protein